MRMLAVYRHAKRSAQLVLVEEVRRFRQFQDTVHDFRRGAVLVRDAEELGARRRIIQASQRRFKFRCGWRFRRHAA